VKRLEPVLFFVAIIVGTFVILVLYLFILQKIYPGSFLPAGGYLPLPQPKPVSRWRVEQPSTQRRASRWRSASASNKKLVWA
jgi:hypothetical protein